LLISLLKLLEGRKGREGRKRPRFTDTLFFRPSSKVGRGRKNDRLPYILSFSQTAFGASHSIGWWVSSAKRARQTLSGGSREDSPFAASRAFGFSPGPTILLRNIPSAVSLDLRSARLPSRSVRPK